VGEGYENWSAKKKVEENVHCIKKYTIFANDRLLRLLTD